jgi:hypothetical protein
MNPSLQDDIKRAIRAGIKVEVLKVTFSGMIVQIEDTAMDIRNEREFENILAAAMAGYAAGLQWALKANKA